MLSAEDAFHDTISNELDVIAAQYGCELEITPMSLLTAQVEWDSDLDNLEILDSEEPDHLKHAGWLCHWLRKKRPISRLIIRNEKLLQPFYEDYYNEASSFIIGAKLAIFHECCKLNFSDEEIIKTLNSLSHEQLLHDCSVFLSHKAVSPHAIYMIYKALLVHSPLH